jgi:hypothetical protein
VIFSSTGAAASGAGAGAGAGVGSARATGTGGVEATGTTSQGAAAFAGDQLLFLTQWPDESTTAVRPLDTT